jgi:hypothetical protein
MKIFGIGLSRTGTHSLAEALNILGYKAAHWDYTKTTIGYHQEEISIDFEKLEQSYDAFTDIPIARIYKQLDVKYSTSKFILTVRKIDDWLKAIKCHLLQPSVFSSANNIAKQLHLDLYNSLNFDRKIFKAAYCKHVDEVTSYFKNREDTLLVINICSGEGWEKLCPFLNKPVPAKPFPHIGNKYIS